MTYLEKTADKNYLYILRRTIPPWNWRENLDELVEYCQKYQIDEVCIKIDTGTFSHYYPDFDWLDNYQQILMTIKDELNAVGVEYSLNPNVTQGHGDRGRGIAQQHPDWDMITDPEGIKCSDCACNASPGWREYIKKQWTMYAETKPATIWIEDDVRTYNHGPVKAGCFCNEHIRRFNERYGKSLTREEIYREVTAPGEPSQIRRQWLELLDVITREMVELAEQTVHAVSPDTIIGLMSSGPQMHTCEGRNWQELHGQMAGSNNKPVLSRPPLGSYREVDLPALVHAADMPRLTRHAFARSTIDEGEIENYPYSNYSKSNTFLRLHNITAMAAGCEALTLNLFDHCGTPMSVNKNIMDALLEMKPFLRGLKEKMIPRGKYKGIQLYFNPEIGKAKNLNSGEGVLNLTSDVMAWGNFLQRLGFATTFDDAEIIALSGQDIRAASESEIKNILSKAVILDAVAFKTLSEMGYSKYLGGTIKKELMLGTTLPLAGEHFYNSEFGGKKNHYFSLAIHQAFPLFTEIDKFPEAIELSEIVDPDIKRLFGGAYLYKNNLGGRVAVYPFEVSKLSEGFLDPSRKKMLYNILKWLSNDAIPLFMEGERDVLPMRCDFDTYSVLSFFNLSHDTLENISAKMYTGNIEVENAQYLTVDGSWEIFNKTESGEKSITFNIDKLTFEQPLFVTVNFKR